MVSVVGAGVSGLATGVALLEAGFYVRLVAEEIPGLTSLAAGAMSGPYCARKLALQWPCGGQTFSFDLGGSMRGKPYPICRAAPERSHSWQAAAPATGSPHG